MRNASLFALAVLSIALCPAARAQGGVTIRPNGACGPALPGDLMVMFNTMSHDVTVYVTQIANGAVSELTLPMRPNSQFELGCSVRGLAQWSWNIKSVKQPNPPPPAPRARPNL